MGCQPLQVVILLCIQLSPTTLTIATALGLSTSTFATTFQDMAAHLQYQQMQVPQVSAPSQAGYRDGRRPFANAANQQYTKATTPKKSPAKAEPVQQKPPASPPLPRQNTKTQPPSPPQVIVDTAHGAKYRRIGFLGEVCANVCYPALPLNTNVNVGWLRPRL